MVITVRNAGEADAAAVSSLNADVQAIHAQALPARFKPVGPDTFPPGVVLEIIANPRNLVFVAEVSGTPAGYLYAEIVDRPETALTYAYRAIYVHHISVRADQRGRGIGNALVAAVRAAAVDREIDEVATDVWSFNEEARAFFVHQGFSPYNVRLSQRP